VKAYVINVPATVERTLHLRRRAHILQQVRAAGLGYEFVTAVDGRLLTAAQRASLVDENAVQAHPAWLTPGLIGASLSHLAAYRAILAAGDTAGLVLEDDAVLPPRIGPLLTALEQEMNPSEVVLLYYRTPRGRRCRLTMTGAVAVDDGYLVEVMDPDAVVAASAYVITREACASLIDARLPVSMGTDHWGTWLRTGGIARLRCVYPRPAGVRNDFKSTVDYLGTGALQRAARAIARTQAPPLHQVLSWRRSLRETQRSAFDLVDSAVDLVESPSRGDWRRLWRKCRDMVYEASDRCWPRGVPRPLLEKPIRLSPRAARFHASIYDERKARLIAGRCESGATAIDVGAHVGIWTVAMARAVGPTGRVIAFEPAGRTRRELRRTLARNACSDIVDVRAEAVAASAGMGGLHETLLTGDQSNSLVRHWNDRAQTVRVPVINLDSADVPPPVRLIKIDAEGAERDVLVGAQGLLTRERPALMIDVHPWLLRETDTSIEALWDELVALGYSVRATGRLVTRSEFVSRDDCFDVEAIPD
jgi:glycosyl transferase, family 25